MPGTDMFEKSGKETTNSLREYLDSLAKLTEDEKIEILRFAESIANIARADGIVQAIL